MGILFGGRGRRRRSDDDDNVQDGKGAGGRAIGAISTITVEEEAALPEPSLDDKAGPIKGRSPTVSPDEAEAVTEEEGVKKRTKGGYPYSVFFIVGNEFCERFSFYGMKAILPIYLTSWLSFKETTATTIIHTFNFSAYFFALFGGILSDNMLGKFRTILYLSIVYCIGNMAMSITSLPGVTGSPPNWWGMAAGLALISVGTGGIKPCVASFGGDQFDAHQIAQLTVFFSVFYFSVNAGSVLSMFLTPLLRSRVHCFGQDSCYPLAFGVPAVLMFAALLVFVAGSRLYKKEPARSNVVLMFFALLGTSLYRGVKQSVQLCWPRRKRNSSGAEHIERQGWLELARDKYEGHFVEEARRMLGVFTIFVPICFFWALYDQQGSWWVYQAVMMKNKQSLFGWTFSILPEQMGLANAVLILVLIPVFSHLLYPGLERAGIRVRALPRILTGMLLAMLAFAMATVLQFWMAASGTFAPSPTDPASQICVSGCVNVLWQLPQYFVITCAEVFLSITGLEFAYSQAPASMKSVCQAGWLLTVAGGNLIVILVTLINPVGWFIKGAGEGGEALPMAWNFVLWTGIMAIGSALFAYLAHGYVYREDDDIGEVLVVEPGAESIAKMVDEGEGGAYLPPLAPTDSQLSFRSDAPLTGRG